VAHTHTHTHTHKVVTQGEAGFTTELTYRRERDGMCEGVGMFGCLCGVCGGEGGVEQDRIHTQTHTKCIYTYYLYTYYI